MPILAMLSPAPVLEAPGGDIVLDRRFVEGMVLHCQLWPGPVYCVLWRGATAIADGARFSPRKLGFELILLDRGADVPASLLDEAQLVYCAADDLRHLHLAEAMRTRIGRLVYTLEAPLAERLAQTRDPTRPLRRQLGAALYNLRGELALRRALARANGVHLNGLATAAGYGGLNPETLVYLDNRIRQPLLARAAEQAARAERLLSGAPLNLVALGPLDPGSGMEDLIPAAHLMANLGVPFRLEIHGIGSLRRSATGSRRWGWTTGCGWPRRSRSRVSFCRRSGARPIWRSCRGGCPRARGPMSRRWAAGCRWWAMRRPGGGGHPCRGAPASRELAAGPPGPRLALRPSGGARSAPGLR